MEVHLEVIVCLPRDATTVNLIRSALADMLTVLGVEEDCADDLRLAVSEACSNVVLHASSDDEYEVKLRVDETRCTISVRDTGHGFDSAALSGVMPSARSVKGRGVALMHAVMDSVDLESSPQAGTVVNLRRALIVRPGSMLAQLRR